MLSGELSTHLTGRYIDYTLNTFSIQEILDFDPNIFSTKNMAKIRNFFNEYAALNTSVNYGFSLAEDAEGGVLLVITGVSVIF